MSVEFTLIDEYNQKYEARITRDEHVAFWRMDPLPYDLFAKLGDQVHKRTSARDICVHASEPAVTFRYAGLSPYLENEKLKIAAVIHNVLELET